jgi:hypothetical protein
MLDLTGGSINQKKDAQAAIVMRPVRGQQQQFRTAWGNGMAPWVTGLQGRGAEDVQSGNIAGGIGHLGGAEV